jgi:festuclavine dehydrogenase
MTEKERMSEQEHLPMIKNEGKLYTACGDGKAPFISALDIAAVAFQVLTDQAPQHSDHRVVGPELLTYDEVNNQDHGSMCESDKRADCCKVE